MTRQEAIDELRAHGKEKVRAQNTRIGATSEQYCVLHGDIRSFANKAKTDHQNLDLRKTQNVDTRRLAALLIQRKQQSIKELEVIIRAFTITEH